MQGFEDSHAPVLIKVSWLANEVQMDGKHAIATEYGVLATIGAVRWFVPWQQVTYIKQDQAPPQTDAQEPVVTPVNR